MASPPTQSSVNERSSFLSFRFSNFKQKIKRTKVPISTVKAPFEVSSFLYRLLQDVDEEKQPRTSLVLDDTALPDPIRLISSSLETPHFQRPSSYSRREVPDFERISRSWFLEDEGTIRASMPLLITDTGSIMRSDESSDEKVDVLESSREVSFNVESPKKLRKKRAHSTDFAYSEANEVSRIDVGMLKSPKARVKFVLEEKKEEMPLTHFAKVHLERGRQGVIFSDRMLKRKEKRYKRQKDDFAATYFKQNRLLKGTVLQQKAARTKARKHRKAFSAVPTVPMLEELKEDDIYNMSLSENLAS